MRVAGNGNGEEGGAEGERAAGGIERKPDTSWGVVVEERDVNRQRVGGGVRFKEEVGKRARSPERGKKFHRKRGN